MNWLTNLWANPTVRTVVARFLVFVFGALVKSGKIPTGFEGLGEMIGPFIEGGALLIPSTSAGTAGGKQATGAV